VKLYFARQRAQSQETGVNDVSVTAFPPTTEVEVVEAREVWSEYRLADGTVLRVKPIMISINRVDEAQWVGGEPVYNMKSTLITDIRAAKQPSSAE
jgi:hypothetical protein